MPAINVCVVVIENGEVLLTKRNDFEIWCLPGGGVDNGETVAQAAIRETKEETGLDIELKSLVGIYSRTGVLPDTHAVLFSGIKIGGELQTQPGETIDVCFFPIDRMPNDLLLGHQKRIEDALQGFRGSIVVTEEMALPPGQTISVNDIVEARKLPREARLEFYQKTVKQATVRVIDDLVR